MEKHEIKIFHPSDISLATMKAIKELNTLGYSFAERLTDEIDNIRYLIISAPQPEDFLKLGMHTVSFLGHTTKPSHDHHSRSTSGS